MIEPKPPRSPGHDVLICCCHQGAHEGVLNGGGGEHGVAPVDFRLSEGGDARDIVTLCGGAVGIVGAVQVRSTPFIEFWSIGLDPAKHRRMVDPHATFPQQFFHVAIAQRIA